MNRYQTLWSRFLLSEASERSPLLQYNYHMIIGDSLFKDELTHLYKTNQLNNSPLSHSKVLKKLGSGTSMVAYLMDSGHVFKIGRYTPGRDAQFYEQYLDKPTKNFVIYDYKVFNEEQTQSPNEMYYVETNKFVSFYEYLKLYHGNNERPPHTPEEIIRVRKLMKMVALKLQKDSTKDLIDFHDLLMRESIRNTFIRTMSSVYRIPENISAKLYNVFVQMMFENPQADLNFGNLGVNFTGTNNFIHPQFFFFDR